MRGFFARRFARGDEITTLASRNHTAQRLTAGDPVRPRRRTTARSLLRFAGTWVGGDLEKRLAEAYAWRGRISFDDRPLRNKPLQFSPEMESRGQGHLRRGRAGSISASDRKISL